MIPPSLTSTSVKKSTEIRLGIGIEAERERGTTVRPAVPGRMSMITIRKMSIPPNRGGAVVLMVIMTVVSLVLQALASVVPGVHLLSGHLPGVSLISAAVNRGGFLILFLGVDF